MRSDEVRLIARELLYLMLDIDVEDAELDFDASDLIERVLAAGPNDTEVVTARVDAVADQAPEFAALARVLTSKFLLCAVLDNVSKRRLVKFAYDEPLGRPDRRSHFYGTQGCTEAASYHVELAVPEGMRARSADIVDNRTGEQLLEGPHDSDRPGLHYVAGAGAEIEPGLQVNYATERGGFLVPAMLVAWVIALELGLAWAVRRPARDRGRGRPGRRGAAVDLGRVREPGAARGRASAGPARAGALPDAAGHGDARRRGRGRHARVPRLGGAAQLDVGSRRHCGPCRGRYSVH